MDGEMAMRAIDDVEIGEDLTPPLAPLSHALHDSYLKSHCSACFSPLASATSHHHLHVSYCSYSCFASDSPLHSSCAEIDLLQITSTNSSCDLDEDTADLRAALRILTAFPTAGASGRISGLLTNRDKLLECRNIINSGYYSEEILWKIQNGGKVMAAARRARESTEISEELKNTELMEAALCAVLTNAVEVMDNEGRSLGIAVYGIDFSWINHSCSPNACYRFEFCSSNSDNVLNPHNSKMRISACSMGAQIQIKVGCCNNGILKGQGHSEYGPRVILRSIRQIESGSEVIIAYTDLLQPKAMRQLDLQSKYQFTCSCLRCSAHPLTYVDQALQDFCVVYDGIPKYTGNTSFSEDAVKKLNDFMDDATSDYFSDSDAESCCVKLEKLLTLNILKSELGSEIAMTFQQNLILHPFNYLSIRAYITLSSTYKIRASHFDPELISRDRFEASDMLRISAAYSLLLAGATHHLLSSEPSLIVSAANFWTNAGESLLALSRSLQWSSAKSQLPDYTDLSIFPCRCSLIDQNGVNLISSYSAYTNFGSKSRDFLECSTYLSEYVWEFLACRSVYLQRISNPINFNWLGRTSSVSDKFITLSAFDTSSKACNAQKKLYLYQLGIHCLHYGGLLSSICYGEEYHFTTHVKSIIQTEHDIAKASVPNHASP